MSVEMSGKILEMIAKNPTITISAIAIALDLTERTVERNIKILRENQQLERIGAKKSGYWQVISK